MSLYHFHIHDGQASRDVEGTELPDHWAARHEAIRLAGRALGDERHLLALGQDWWMDVTDRDGSVLFRLDFHMTDSPALHRRGA